MASFRELIELGNQALGHLKAGEYASASDKIGDTLCNGFHMIGDLGRQLFGFRTSPMELPDQADFNKWYSQAQIELAPRGAISDWDFLKIFTLVKQLIENIRSLYGLFFTTDPVTETPNV